VRLGAVRQGQRSVGVGGFQNVAILLKHGRVPIDQRPGGALVLGIIAVEQLHQLDTAVVDRRRAIDDDMTDAAGLGHVHTPAERQIPMIAHRPGRRRIGGSGYAVSSGRIEDIDDRRGDEPVIGLFDLILTGHRLRVVTECPAMHEEKWALSKLFSISRSGAVCHWS
jgi:hypothetical protein